MAKIKISENGSASMDANDLYKSLQKNVDLDKLSKIVKIEKKQS